MTIEETLNAAKFVVNEKGERTAVYLPVEAWKTLVEWINQQKTETTTPQPVSNLDELWGDFWPEDEPIEDFVDAVRHWRHDDEVTIPNEITLQTFQDTDAGKNIIRALDKDDLFEQLEL